MRVLLASSLGGVGHLTPLVMVGEAVRRLGGETLVLVPPSLTQAIERTDLRYVVGSEPPHVVVDEVWETVRAGPPNAVAGLIDRELFARHCAQAMLDPARDVADAWRPELVVREPCEYASAVVACERGIPQAQIAISLSALERGVLELTTPILERSCPGVAGAIGSAPYLTSFPASLDPSPWPDTRRFRPPAHGAAPLPDWWPGDGRPLVYLTFGTVTGHLREATAVFRTALDAVSGLTARVLLTVGRSFELGRLPSVPENTHVEQWISQADVLAEATLVVCHGGSGTTFGALAAGVPLVICPLFADQPTNGQMIETAGCGLAVGGRDGAPGLLRGLGPADVGPLRDAIQRVLDEPGYRRGAERVAAEIAEAAALDQVVEQLGVG